MIDAGKCRTQHVMDTPIAKTTPCLGKINDGHTDLRILRRGLRRVAVTVSGKPHKTTGVAFGKAVSRWPSRWPDASLVGLPFYPEDILEHVHIEIGFGQQLLEPVVLNFQVTQPLGFGRLHATILGSSLVEGGIAETALAAEFLDRHPGFGLFQKADDLFFGKSCSFHIRHSP